MLSSLVLKVTKKIFKKIYCIRKLNIVDSTQKVVFIQQVEHILAANFEDANFHVQELADALPISRIQLFRNVKNFVGKTPTEYIRTFRLQKGERLLQESLFQIKEIAYRIGFKNHAHFTNSFTELYGLPPRDWRVKHRRK